MQKIKLLSMLLSALLVVSCNNYIEGGVPPSNNRTVLRFVSASGTNILDSLQVLDNGNTPREVSAELMSIKGIRTSDNQPLEMQNYLLYSSKPADSAYPRETLLDLSWVDFNIAQAEKRPREYTEVYDICLQSRRVFGNDELHRLKWYVSISGYDYNAYKCELDGQEVELTNDPLYNEHTYNGRHYVNAMLTIKCK